MASQIAMAKTVGLWSDTRTKST